MLPEIILFSVLSIALLLIRSKEIKLNDFKVEIKGYMVLLIMAVIEITAQFLFQLLTSKSPS